jgi:hypothetical protein
MNLIFKDSLMKLAEREEQILRVKSHSFQSEMISVREDSLRTEVNLLIKTTIEAALVEELESFRTSRTGPGPRRSGYFHRLLDTQYGRTDKGRFLTFQEDKTRKRG